MTVSEARTLVRLVERRDAMTALLAEDLEEKIAVEIAIEGQAHEELITWLEDQGRAAVAAAFESWLQSKVTAIDVQLTNLGVEGLS
ncbi:MAG: hypothetical protein JSW58_08550 [Candidatus Latescibacterota bacterium]|nr:MAG: hypothetical protein JSW58_08550 [Candidatus Latescibacterota bacterium]